MQIDSEGNMIFRSLKGDHYYFTMALLFLGSVIMAFIGIYDYLNGPSSIVWTYFYAIVSVLLILLVIPFGIAMNSLRFVLEKGGVRIPNSMLLTGVKIQAFIPYPMITKFYGTTRILAPAFSPVSSSDAVMIVFTNENGRRGDMVAVSPEEKELFISELTKRTGIGVSEDPHAKKPKG